MPLPRLTTADVETLERLRSDPAHWTWYGSYQCAADPRLMVRDRLGLGWTLNMAHRRAQLVMRGVLLGVVLLTVVLILVVRAT